MNDLAPAQSLSDKFDLHLNAAGAWLLEGPADYMDARGIDVMNAILEGADQVFDHLALKHRDWGRAVLARLRMDYASWCSTNQTGPAVDTCSEAMIQTRAKTQSDDRTRCVVSAQPPLLEVSDG